MNKIQIQASVMKALKEFSPSEVRVHQESADVVRLLVISEKFKDMSVFRRINTCSKLLIRSSTLHYLFIIEPVTEAELKTRKSPWPSSEDSDKDAWNDYDSLN